MKSTLVDQAMQELLFELSYTFFRTRAESNRIMGETQQTSGRWGLLNTLARRGPMTVAQIARSRPVARQGVQRLADALADEGLVEFIDNPQHRRSMNVQITPRGHAALAKLNDKIGSWSADLARGFREPELRTAVKVLRRLRQRLATEQAFESGDD